MPVLQFGLLQELLLLFEVLDFLSVLSLLFHDLLQAIIIATLLSFIVLLFVLFFQLAKFLFQLDAFFFFSLWSSRGEGNKYLCIKAMTNESYTFPFKVLLSTVKLQLQLGDLGVLLGLNFLLRALSKLSLLLELLLALVLLG